MADNKVTIDLQIASKGMDPAVQKSQAIRDNLTAAGGAMSRTGGGGGTAGSRAISEKAAGQEYAAQRGVAGATGASARNFAAESQGLGGLVRLYATVAANTYAAAAAFTALSKAMDTTNMIKGLDQLGAVGGRNLGALSKQLAQASDGAINLRDAAQAVAQASAAGLGGAQILELGEIAKKASQALGVSMPDALSRISRGVIKLEPELLDELGIFTKIDEASRKYALSLGKSVSALTDFEKRQGFANAVAEEGKRKFESIKLDVNPYDKLLASFQNLLQTGLELVNKVLAPIVKTLSESPVALVAILALIGKTLLSQAIPAIGQYKKGLEDQAVSATAALESAKKLRAEHRKTIDTLEATRIGQEDSNTAKKAGIELDKLAQKAGLSKSTQKILANAPDVRAELQSTAAIKTTTEALEKQQKQLEKRTYSETAASQKRAAENAAEVAQIKATIAALKDRTRAAEEYAAVTGPNVRVGKVGLFSQEAKQIRDLKAATSKSTSIGILQDVSKTIDSSSISDAFKVLGKGLTDNTDKLTTFGKVMTAVRGTGAIFSGVLSGIASALGTLNIAVSIGLAAIAALDFLFSTNSKQAEESSKAYDALTSSLENTNRTIEVLNKKDPLAQFNTESLSAVSTAFDDLTNNMQNSFEKMKANIAMMSWFDEIKDGIKSIFNQDELSKNSKQFALSITKALSLATEGAAKTTTIENLTKLLGVNPEDLKSLSKIDFTFKTQEQAQAQLKELGKALLATKGTAQEVDAALKSFNKTFDEILVAAIPTDPMAKLGQETVKSAKAIKMALDDSSQALTKLTELSKDTASLRIFDTKTGTELARNSDLINKLSSDITNYQARIKALSADEKELGVIRKQGVGGRTETAAKNREIDLELVRIKSQKQLAESGIKAAEVALAPFKESATQGADAAFKRGSKLIDDSIAQGFARASITISTAYATIAGDTKAGALRRAELEKQSISLQMQQLDSQINMVDSQAALRNAIEENTIALKRQEVTSSTKLSAEEKTTQLDALAKREEALKTTPFTPSEEQSRKALQARRAEFSAQRKGIDIRAGIEVSGIEVTAAKDLLDTELKALQAKKQANDYRQQGLSYLSDETLLANKLLDEQIRTKQNAIEIADINDKIRQAEEGAVAATKAKRTEDAKTLRQSAESFKVRKTGILARQETGTSIAETEDLAKVQANARARITAQLALDKTVFDTALSNENTLFTLKEDNLQKLAALGALSPEVQAKAQADLDLEKEKSRTKTATFELEQQQSLKLFELRQIRDKQVVDSPEYAQAQALVTATTAYYDATLANEARVTQAKQATLTVLGANSIELAKQKTTMDSLVLTTESLAAVFGTVGEAIGAVAQALQKSADSEKQNLAARIALEAQLEAATKSEDPKALANVNKAIADQDKKSAKDKLNNDIALLNSSKKMFKEKTVAYKALDAIEKVQHVRRIFESNKELITSIMNAGKELATKLGFMGTEQAALASAAAGEVAMETAKNTASATSAIPAIFAKFSAMMGPWGWAAAAAVVAALGLKGGSKSPPAGFTAEEQQKVQGTGQMYEGGKLVDRAGGVLGDRTAKAKSVGDSIDELSKVFFDVLGSDSSKMLGYLRGIEENTLGLAKALTGSATGVLGDKPLGIGESSRGSGLAGFLFGKSKTSIADQGIEVTGSLEKLSQGIGNFSAYVNTVTKSSGFLGFGGGTRYNTTRDKVETTAVDAIAKIFKNVQGVLVTAAESLEGSGMRVTEVLRDIPIKIKASAKDLSAKEFAEAVQAEISVALNAAAEKAFPYMSEYVRVGEEYWTTVARVNKEGEVLNQGLKMIGLSIIKAAEGTTGMEAAATRVAAQQNLLKAFSGDLDAATSSIQFYFDNFLTEQERSTYYTEQLTTGFKDLGMATVPTLEQFTKMVAGLDANDEAQANTLASLLKLAPAYDKLRQAQEKTSQLQEDLWTLEGKGAQALEAQRARELRSMSAVDAALQRRINALEDEKSAYDKLRGALKETVEGIKTSVTGLRDARNSLLTGPDSFMTPQQRLETQKSQYTTALAAARGPLDTPEQRKTAQTAAQTATRLLQEIKTSGDVLFASGQENVDLRAWLAQTAGETADILEASQVGFEEQIASIDAGTNVLKSVDSTLTSIKTLWADYITAQTVTSEAPVNQAPATTQAPNSVADAQVASAMLQVAVQKETNKLLQQQLELQAEQLRSNAIAMKAQTDELNRAAEERRLAAEYAERNKPSFGYASGDGA